MNDIVIHKATQFHPVLNDHLLLFEFKLILFYFILSQKTNKLFLFKKKRIIKFVTIIKKK